MGGHTPTPWDFVREVLRGGIYFSIRRSGMEDIDIHEGENGEADAAFIVRAVNAHAELVAALTRLLSAAKLLQANSEGCAVNHHGADFEQQGLPGWLRDTASDIETAIAALAKAGA